MFRRTVGTFFDECAAIDASSFELPPDDQFVGDAPNGLVLELAAIGGEAHVDDGVAN